MTYIIGDRVITFSGKGLTPEEENIIRAHPDMLRYCLNSTVLNYLVSMKKIVHLYTDVITIYSTLLLKVPNYDDVTHMTNKTKLNFVRLEEDLNVVFGNSLTSVNEGWEQKSYEKQLKPMVVLILKSCNELFNHLFKTLNCIDVFFLAFDNLKKLLIPCLLSHTQMIQKLIAGAIYFFGLMTVADEVSNVGEFDDTVIRQLTKIDSITSGLEREARLLDMVFTTIDSALKQYTNILLGRAILKRDVEEVECRIIKRRDVCFQAAEHVVSIPLTGDNLTALSMLHFIKHIFYFISAILVVVVVVLYRVYAVIFG